MPKHEDFPQLFHISIRNTELVSSCKKRALVNSCKSSFSYLRLRHQHKYFILAKFGKRDVIFDDGDQSECNFDQSWFAHLHVEVYYVWNYIECKVIAEQSCEPIRSEQVYRNAVSLKNAVYFWTVNKNHSFQLKTKLPEATFWTKIENALVLML